MLPARLTARHAPRRAFTVLALESSADDSCAAVVTHDRRILSNVVVKQHALHETYGGIAPWPAIQAHQANMASAVRRALDEAGLAAPDVDGIAFTRGPGMGGCLSVGFNAAKSLGAALNKPIVGVHHMQAHALTPLLTAPRPPPFPFLTLLVSGGHTLLLLARAHAHFRVLASTQDKSVGAGFDLVARALGLAWGTHGPGAALERFCKTEVDAGALAAQGIEIPVLKVPMRGRLAFSYSGPHTLVDKYIEGRGGLASMGEMERVALAQAFQTSAVRQLEDKVVMALKQCEQEGIPIRHLVVSGGVASNNFLRERLRARLDAYEAASEEGAKIEVLFPPQHCAQANNAAMIAWASMHRFLAGDTDDYTVDLRATWHIEELSGSAEVDKKYYDHSGAKAPVV